MTKLSNSFQFSNGKAVKNRLTLAPLTNCQSEIDGTLGNDEFQWLERTAKGGFGLIMTCASYIMKTGQAWPGQLGIYDDHLLPGLKKLASMIKSHQALGLVQLFHGGVRCPSMLTGVQPVSASEYELALPNFEKPRALSVPEIHDIIEKFAMAAKRAHEAGFDGVEVHGANGYLITQFISTQTNLRKDDYGGNLENRARLAREVVRACRQAVPKSFLVGIRISPDNPETGLDIDDNLQIAKWLVEDGADFIDISQMDSTGTSLKYPTPIITLFRERLGSRFPLIAGGKVRTLQDAEKVLDMGATLVYLGSIAIGNSDWPNCALSNPAYQATMLPYSMDYLKSQGVSDTFIRYIKGLSRGLI